MTATLTTSPAPTIPTQARPGPTVRVCLLPETFRFADINPLAGERYSTSLARDLPPWALREMPVTPAAWDALVRAGATSRIVDPFRICSLADIAVALRWCVLGAPPPDVCPDCWGTLVAVDTDGSMTGRVGALHLCVCTDQLWAVSR